MRTAGGVAVLGLLLLYLATGLTVVQQDEVGVVRRFGAVLSDPWGPGLHWALPWGFDRVDRVKIRQTRSLAVGASPLTQAPLTRSPDPANDDFLTGDLNLVTVQATLQYRVVDAARYLFSAASIDEALRLATESALAQAVAGRGVDVLLTTARADLAVQVERAVREVAMKEGLGISVRAVRLGRLTPPSAVAAAFADADRARSDRRQTVTQALEYRDGARADASSQAQEIADRALARQQRTEELARGEADRFRRVLAEVQKDPDAVRRRLYLEALGELLPRFANKVVVQPGKDVDLSLFATGTSSAGPASASETAPAAPSPPGRSR